MASKVPGGRSFRWTGKRAICAVLSGTGDDGSRGLQAVIERGGFVIAQDPDEAAYDGMPRSAIMTGVVDLVRHRQQTVLSGPCVLASRRWLRHQPDSALSLWFVERVGDIKGRVRKIAIVALARKLLVALWRHVETGEVPAGARFTAA